MGTFFSGVVTLFSRLMDHSVEISALICLMFFVKWLVAKKLPSWWHYSLWLMLLVRMLVPIEFENCLNVFNFIPDIREHQVFEMIIDSPSGNEMLTPEIISETPPSESNWWFLLKNSLPMLWLVGAMVFGICILSESILFWRSVRRIPPITDKKVLHLLAKCKNRMKIQAAIDVIVTDKVRSPALFGYFHPRLLLPVGVFERLSDEDLSYAFMHELGHLKRHDIGVSWIVAVLQVAYWFNPLVWIAFYQMRIDQESACDESVLSRIKHHQSVDYAKAIVGFIEKFFQNCQLPSLVGVIENKTQLKRRIADIVHYKKSSQKVTVAAGALFIATGFIFYSFTGVAKEKQAQSVMEPVVEKSFVDVKYVVNEADIIPSGFFASQAKATRKPQHLMRSDVSHSNGKAGNISEVPQEDHGAYPNDEAFSLNPDGITNEATLVVRSQPTKKRKYPSFSVASFYKAEQSTDTRRIVKKTAKLTEDPGPRMVKTIPPANMEPEQKMEAEGDQEQPEETKAFSLAASSKAAGPDSAWPWASLVASGEEFTVKRGVEVSRDASVTENGPGTFVQQAGLRETKVVPGVNQGRAVHPSETVVPTANGKMMTGAGNEMLPGSGVSHSMVKTDRREDGDGVSFLVSNVDKPPRVIRSIPPRYPFMAKRDDIAGYIKLRFIITKDGDAIETTVAESNPKGVFDKSALEALKSYRFKPGTKDGKAVDVQVSLPIKFNLS